MLPDTPLQPTSGLALAETRKLEIRRTFAKRRRNQLWLLVVFAPIVFGELLYQRHVAATVLGMSPQVAAPIFLVLAVVGLLYSLRNWRCPACSKYLGRSINARNCLNCGVRLRG